VKLSLKLEYACRVLAQLSKRQEGAQLAHIEELAKAEGIPANYLVQVLNDLRNAGLIVSRRGKQGGYALARTPREITLYDIVHAVDAEMLEGQASAKGESGPRVAEIWSGVSERLGADLRAIRLDELAPREGQNMYYI